MPSAWPGGTPYRTACARAEWRGSSPPTESRAVPDRWRDAVIKVVRQRLALHQHPEALADALRAVPRSQPFGSVDDLAAITVPTVVVASGDEADPEHPQAVGEAYAAAIPGARLVTDEPGRSPVAWQGSQLSRLIAEVVVEARL